MITGVIIAVVAGGLFWLAYRRPRPRRWWLPRPARLVPAAVPAAAEVDRQHRHLRAGGLIGEAAFDGTKARFRALLAADQTAEVEEELRPGLAFTVQVRALAEIGTPQAGRVLERLLTRPLTRDRVEQAWYWADVAAGLRAMDHTPALPAVLRRADDTAGLAQGALLAAEAVAFTNFPSVLRDPDHPNARAAARALTRAACGCRDGTVDPAAMLRAGLGDHLAALSETTAGATDPWRAAAAVEAGRVSRRLDHWARVLPCEVRPSAEQQALRLRSTCYRRKAWLVEVVGRLIDRFPFLPSDEQAAALAVFAELRADVSMLFPAPPDHRCEWWGEAVRALTWSRAPGMGPALAGQAERLLRSRRSRPHAAVALSALRGQRCAEAEQALLRGTCTTNHCVRQAAAGAFGWWEPFDPAAVVKCLRAARADAEAGLRQAATGALARLGERAVVDELTAALAGEEPELRQAAARAVAAEGLTWLWPDLQAVADGPDPDTALVASESLERLREQLFGPLG
jgi:HEAT repeat protein